MNKPKKYKLQVPINLKLKEKAEKDAKNLGLSSIQEYIRFLVYNYSGKATFSIKPKLSLQKKSNAKKLLNALNKAQKSKKIWTDKDGLKYQKRIREESQKRLEKNNWL